MNTIVLKYNNFSNAIQSCWEKLYLKNPNLGIGGVHRWIQGGKWEGDAALRPTPNYEHEVAPPSSKTCNLKANCQNSITIRFRVNFLCSRCGYRGRALRKRPTPYQRTTSPNSILAPHPTQKIVCQRPTFRGLTPFVRKGFFCCLHLLKNNDQKLAPDLNLWGPTYTQIWGGALKNVRALHARHNLWRPTPRKILSPHLVSSF